MDDVTANVGQLYEALRQVWADLNQLAFDFHRALSEEGRDLKGPEQYSYLPRRLALPRDHAWLYADANLGGAPTTAPAIFAAVYVLFEANEEQHKPGPPGRPELWFFFGLVQAPRLSPLDVWTYLKDSERKSYDRPPQLGGALSHYRFADESQTWDALAVGFELGDIDGPAALRDKAVRPLLAEAQHLGW